MIEIEESTLNVYMEYHTILFNYLACSPNFILKDRDKIVNYIVESFFKEYSNQTKYSKEDSIHIIKRLQDKLEQKMKEIISSKSIYYWFHLYRRIGPVASFEQESNLTVYLYRNILESAFIKYGNIQTNRELVFSTKKRM